jgi:hypothetical protein
MTRTKNPQNEKAIREASRINKIIAPWLEASTEREMWTVQLRAGVEITVLCPLGAAVEVEEAGHHIRAAG